MTDLNKEPAFVTSMRSLDKTLAVVHRNINEFLMLFDEHERLEAAKKNEVVQKPEPVVHANSAMYYISRLKDLYDTFSINNETLQTHAVDFNKEQCEDWLKQYAVIAQTGGVSDLIDSTSYAVTLLNKEHVEVAKTAQLLYFLADKINKINNDIVKEPHEYTTTNEIIAYISSLAFSNQVDVGGFQSNILAIDKALNRAASVVNGPGQFIKELMTNKDNWVNKLFSLIFSEQQVPYYTEWLNEPFKYSVEIAYVVRNTSLLLTMSSRWIVFNDTPVDEVILPEITSSVEDEDSEITAVANKLALFIIKLRATSYRLNEDYFSTYGDVQVTNFSKHGHFYTTLLNLKKIFTAVENTFTGVNLIADVKISIVTILFADLVTNSARNSVIKHAYTQVDRLAIVDPTIHKLVNEFYNTTYPSEGLKTNSFIGDLLEAFNTRDLSFRLLNDIDHENGDGIRNLVDVIEAAALVHDYSEHYISLCDNTPPPAEDYSSVTDVLELTKIYNPPTLVDAVNVSNAAAQNVKDMLTKVSTFFETKEGGEIKNQLDGRVSESLSMMTGMADKMVDIRNSLHPQPGVYERFKDITTPELLGDVAKTFSGEISNHYVGKVRVGKVKTMTVFKQYTQDLLTHTNVLSDEWVDSFYTDSKTGDLQFLIKLGTEVYVVIAFKPSASDVLVLRFDKEPNNIEDQEVQMLVSSYMNQLL